MVSIGRNRLPPDEIRCSAISGISSTFDPAMARIRSLTRAMSDAVTAIIGSIEARLSVRSTGLARLTMLLRGFASLRSHGRGGLSRAQMASRSRL